LTTTVQRNSASRPEVEFPSVSQVTVHFPGVPQVSLQFPLCISSCLAVSAMCLRLPCSFRCVPKVALQLPCVPQVALQFSPCTRHSPFPRVQLGLGKILRRCGFPFPLCAFGLILRMRFYRMLYKGTVTFGTICSLTL
jgi:hypothetical protein